MNKSIKILLASTALSAAVALPAWSAVQTNSAAGLRPFHTLVEQAAEAMPLVLASDDHDNGEDHGKDGKDDNDGHHDRNARGGSQRGHDDRGGDDRDVCDVNVGGTAYCGDALGTPAPAGTFASPKNGLFRDGDGASPQVQMK